MDWHGCDHAYSNERLDAYTLELNECAFASSEAAAAKDCANNPDAPLPPLHLDGTYFCVNHQTHLAASSLMVVIWGIAFLNIMYTTAIFLRMGCHFLRMQTCIKSYVKTHVRRIAC